MTDYQKLPSALLPKIEDPSVNIVTQIDLDARIAAAFADGAKSNDVAALIKDTEHGAASASELAEQARNHALDPALSGSELKDARKCMDDAAFRRDRLQAALGKLRKLALATTLAAFWSRFRIPERELTRKTRSAFSNLSFPPSLPERDWDLPYAARSSRPMAGDCGRPMQVHMALFSMYSYPELTR